MDDIGSCKTCRYFDSKDWDSETKNWCTYNDLPAINEGLCGHYDSMIKPCPFCGGSPKLESDPHRYEFGRDRFRIVCSSCYSGTKWYDGPNEAWLMWSGRVEE